MLCIVWVAVVRRPALAFVTDPLCSLRYYCNDMRQKRVVSVSVDNVIRAPDVCSTVCAVLLERVEPTVETPAGLATGRGASAPPAQTAGACGVDSRGVSSPQCTTAPLSQEAVLNSIPGPDLLLLLPLLLLLLTLTLTHARPTGNPCLLLWVSRTRCRR